MAMLNTKLNIPNANMPMMTSQMDRVTNNLYIGSFMCLTNSNIHNSNIKLIIDCTVEGNGKNFAGVEKIQIPVDDTLMANISSYFDLCADRIDHVQRMGGNVLVHCMAGVSRSSTICLAYLMKYPKLRLRQAYAMLKSVRPIVRPNENFFKQLVAYEFRLFGDNTVSIVNSAYGHIPDVYQSSINLNRDISFISDKYLTKYNQTGSISLLKNQ